MLIVYLIVLFVHFCHPLWCSIDITEVLKGEGCCLIAVAVY